MSNAWYKGNLDSSLPTKKQTITQNQFISITQFYTKPNVGPIDHFTPVSQTGITIFQVTQYGTAGDLGLKKEGKVLPYSLPSVGPGADPGVQAVPHRLREVNHVINPAVGCHYCR